ncbi:MAG: hypothetical protein JOZ62_04175 [Acidobacteriaceae bacterium]|nr:hypothetical protein [Acidobacteriaceae bacterium]
MTDFASKCFDQLLSALKRIASEINGNVRLQFKDLPAKAPALSSVDRSRFTCVTFSQGGALYRAAVVID